MNQVKSIDKLLQFKMSTEENNPTNYLDLYIHRNDNIGIGIYRKPTCTDTTVQFASNHPYEHKIASFFFCINRMITLPITEQQNNKNGKLYLK